ncbi:nodulation protein NolF [Luteitalea sp. TBR-22]|uniref:efflux RND transporter periplasmic adaptor subunit n=1 Tax=Luteitalea sp. TBR-22 TaxID=2802971 RepID=UPI001AF574B4|nr:efflux RND transporter periplasmic adaptor subunit [Luteitalea sp. TBR-22]BCS34288.1 nodulation protein NolF [Luteitalea sp. TBR-22]
MNAHARHRRIDLTAALAGVAATLVLAAGCGNGAAKEAEAKAAAPAAPPVLDIGKENTVRVTLDDIRTGPVISGTLAPKDQATVRAEVGGSVLSVSAEQGQAVRRGQVLARIEARTAGEAVTSAESSVRSQEQALELAKRELARAEKLVSAGAVAERAVEAARNEVVRLESEVAGARSRLLNAREALGDATVTAPISGVVAERPVNAGDVVAPGTALYTIVDPTSIQLEASVPSESLAAVRVGAQVTFQVRGYPDQAFTGRIERVSPTADPTTRQVPIWVTVDNRSGRLVAGLFADGRVTQEERRGLVLPLSVIADPETQPSVLRIRGGKVEKVSVRLGLVDAQNERAEVVEGLADGDVLLTGVAQGVTPGTQVRVTDRSQAAAPAATPASAAPKS